MANGDAWIVYEQFPPYSPRFVARFYSMNAGGTLRGPFGEPLIGDTVEEVRAKIPNGLSPIPEAKPQERGGAAIVETWI